MDSGIIDLYETGNASEFLKISKSKQHQIKSEIDFTSYIYNTPVQQNNNFLFFYFQEKLPDITVLPVHIKEFSLNADVTSFYYAQESKDFNPLDYFKQKAFNNEYAPKLETIKKSIIKSNTLKNSYKNGIDVTSIYYSNQILTRDTVPFSPISTKLKNIVSTVTLKSSAQNKPTDVLTQNIPENELYTQLVLGLILIMFAVFAWARYYYNKYVPRIFETLFNYSLFSKLFRERNILSQNASRIYNFVFMINTAVFANQIVMYFGIKVFQLSYFYTLFLFFVAIFFISIFKTLIIRLLGFILDIGRTISEYIFCSQMINQAIGLFLFPVILSIPYINIQIRPYLILSGIIIVVLLYFMQIYRLVQIILNKHFSIFYLILYLCALEFLPVLLILKISSIYVK
jgi:hypothetical protein